MRQTVMIVDDSMPVHILVKKQLEPEQLSFHSVYDGLTAVSAAVTLRPDLILLDVDMPRTNGFEACRYLKANPLTAAIPLIFVSGDSLVSDKVKALDLGAIDYITKPFKVDEFRARVRSALRTTPAAADGQMADGLGGIWTKPYFDVHLKARLSQAQRSGRPLSCVVADMDRWGTVISKMGPQLVTEVVRSVARALLLRCRTEDLIFQFENGRFAMLLNETGRYQASKMIDRLRIDVEQQFAVADKSRVKVTYSFGITDTLIAPGEELFERAVNNLNRAKRRGGNCVAVGRDRQATPLAA